MDTPNNWSLVRLGDTNMTVLDPGLDVRGRRVIDNNGREIGYVDDLMIDDTEKRVRFLRVTDGGFLGIGGQKFLVPVDAIVRTEKGAVHINRSREHVEAGPVYNPELMDRTYIEQVYGYYGVMPFWGVGYVYPSYPFYL
jgi:sporulation protein YlmC with PRC-barrel domain